VTRRPQKGASARRSADAGRTPRASPARRRHGDGAPPTLRSTLTCWRGVRASRRSRRVGLTRRARPRTPHRSPGAAAAPARRATPATHALTTLARPRAPRNHTRRCGPPLSAPLVSWFRPEGAAGGGAGGRAAQARAGPRRPPQASRLPAAPHRRPADSRPRAQKPPCNRTL
jgi:hypothetical protein